MTPGSGPATSIRLRVRLFGRYRDLVPTDGAAGPAADSLELDVPAGGTVADLVAALRASAPGALPDRPVVAVNHRPAAYDSPLDPADEIALIPPVAGG